MALSLATGANPGEEPSPTHCDYTKGSVQHDCVSQMSRGAKGHRSLGVRSQASSRDRLLSPWAHKAARPKQGASSYPSGRRLSTGPYSRGDLHSPNQVGTSKPGGDPRQSQPESSEELQAQVTSRHVTSKNGVTVLDPILKTQRKWVDSNLKRNASEIPSCHTSRYDTPQLSLTSPASIRLANKVASPHRPATPKVTRSQGCSPRDRAKTRAVPISEISKRMTSVRFAARRYHQRSPPLPSLRYGISQGVGPGTSPER